MGWDETDSEGAGDYNHCCGAALLFGLSPFSALQMEEKLQQSLPKAVPGSLTDALTLTPLRSKDGEKEEQPSQATSLAAA